MKILLLIPAYLGCLYFAMAFTYADFDISKWEKIDRGFIAGFGVIGICVITGIAVSTKIKL